MTEEERREWERKNPKPLPPSKKWSFMQKYYHRGAFFQMDKSILPKVMQVKHFGRSGRTKWTHLVNEDTTDWNNSWTANCPLRAKYDTRMAGMNAPIEKPKGIVRLSQLHLMEFLLRSHLVVRVSVILVS